PLADQFAFCVTAWEALHGARPFTGANITELVADLKRPLVARGAVDRVLVRGLARDPAARWPSMDALLDALAVRRARWIVPAALAKRVPCLRDWQRRFAALATALAKADAEVVTRAPQLVADLPPVSRCADLDALAAAPALPADPQLRTKLDALAAELDAAPYQL